MPTYCLTPFLLLTHLLTVTSRSTRMTSHPAPTASPLAVVQGLPQLSKAQNTYRAKHGDGLGIPDADYKGESYGAYGHYGAYYGDTGEGYVNTKGGYGDLHDVGYDPPKGGYGNSGHGPPQGGYGPPKGGYHDNGYSHGGGEGGYRPNHEDHSGGSNFKDGGSYSGPSGGSYEHHSGSYKHQSGGYHDEAHSEGYKGNGHSGGYSNTGGYGGSGHNGGGGYNNEGYNDGGYSNGGYSGGHGEGGGYDNGGYNSGGHNGEGYGGHNGGGGYGGEKGYSGGGGYNHGGYSGGRGHSSGYGGSPACDCSRYNTLALAAASAVLSALVGGVLAQAAAGGGRAQASTLTSALPLPLSWRQLRDALGQDVGARMGPAAGVLAVDVTCALAEKLEKREKMREMKTEEEAQARDGYGYGGAYSCSCQTSTMGVLAAFAALAGLLAAAIAQAAAAGGGRSLAGEGGGRPLEGADKGAGGGMSQILNGLQDGSRWSVSRSGLRLSVSLLELLVAPPSGDLCLPRRLCLVNRRAVDDGEPYGTLLQLASLPVSWLLLHSGRGQFSQLCRAVQTARTEGRCEAQLPCP